jgi:hypothetical protein
MHWTTNREQRETAALIARHEREGASQAELSRSLGISVWGLRYRKQRAKAIRDRATSSLKLPASRFVPVSPRAHAAVKLLIGDHNVFRTLYKRFERGAFPFDLADDATHVEIDRARLSMLVDEIE